MSKREMQETKHFLSLVTSIYAWGSYTLVQFTLHFTRFILFFVPFLIWVVTRINILSFSILKFSFLSTTIFSVSKILCYDFSLIRFEFDTISFLLLMREWKTKKKLCSYFCSFIFMWLVDHRKTLYKIWSRDHFSFF